MLRLRGGANDVPQATFHTGQAETQVTEVQGRGRDVSSDIPNDDNDVSTEQVI